MRFKFQKRSVLKLADRIILHKHGYNTPPLGAKLGSMACPRVHTRDSKELIFLTTPSFRNGVIRIDIDQAVIFTVAMDNYARRKLQPN
jgi:hypothetical protein